MEGAVSPICRLNALAIRIEATVQPNFTFSLPTCKYLLLEEIYILTLQSWYGYECPKENEFSDKPTY